MIMLDTAIILLLSYEVDTTDLKLLVFTSLLQFEIGILGIKLLYCNES